MNKNNVLGIEVKCHNIKREEILIGIIKRDVKHFYRTYKNKPYSVGNAYNMLRGKITTLYYMGLINYENYKLMTDRLFNLYRFTRETAENYKKQHPFRWRLTGERKNMLKLFLQVATFLFILGSWIFLLILL